MVAAALIAVTALTLSAGAAPADPPEEPPIDPFAQAARPANYSEPAPPGGVAIPPTVGPMIGAPPGAATGPMGVYPPAPPSNWPLAGQPPIAAPGPQFMDAGQFQQAPLPYDPCVPPGGSEPPAGQSLVPVGTNSVYRLLDHLEAKVVARGYYENDQRICWSGMEETFGAEADITTRLRQRYGDFEFLIDGEFYVNQPYDSNELMDDAERRSYAANFRVNEFDISQLSLSTKYDDWTFTIGKFVTPFGRTYFPLYTNAMWDAPFIRTEVIGWRETGILAHYKSGWFVADVALTNGGQDLGTNSSKFVVARLGLESDDWAVGASAKKGNGVGSEMDKEIDNHFGVDLMFRSGPFRISSECVFDQYGFGRPGFGLPDNPLDNITWVRSIYYRDVSSGQAGVPCTGVGYYVNADYNTDYNAGPWTATVNYGDYYPLYTGTAPDQRVQHRGVAKVGFRFAKPLVVYSALIVENGWYIAQEKRAPHSLRPAGRLPVDVLRVCSKRRGSPGFSRNAPQTA